MGYTSHEVLRECIVLRGLRARTLPAAYERGMNGQLINCDAV